MRSVVLLFGALFLWLATETGLAQDAVPEAGNEPQLRVEAGMHTAARLRDQPLHRFARRRR